MSVLNNFSLEGKVVVVTGGTGVLGGAFVEAIADAGAAVGVLGRNEAVANERAEKIRSVGGKAIALVADVMKEEELVKARDLILQEFGKVDGLVNGAGGNMPIGVLQNEEDLS